MSYIIILITASSKKEAQRLAKGLVAKRLAACANIVPDIESIFWWEGKIDRAKEVLLILKTKASLFKKIMFEVKKLHSYDCPEIIALPISKGSKEYLNWINQSVGMLS